MPINRPDVDRAARAAPRAVDIEPRGAGQDGSPDRARPQGAVPAPRAAFQRSMTRDASACAAAVSARSSAVSCMSRMRVRCPMPLC